jgi:hypothetical protein
MVIYSYLLLLTTLLAYVPQKEVIEADCTEERPCHGENYQMWSDEEDELYHERTDSPWPGKRVDPLIEELQHPW